MSEQPCAAIERTARHDPACRVFSYLRSRIWKEDHGEVRQGGSSCRARGAFPRSRRCPADRVPRPDRRPAEAAASRPGRERDLRRGKDTLARLAAKEVGLDFLAEDLKGPTAIAFVSGEPVEAAKTLRDFAKDNPALVLKSGAMDGAQLSAEAVKKLADLESREVLLAKAAGASRPRLVRRRSHSTLCPSRQCAPSMLCAKAERGGLTRQAMFHAATGCVKQTNNLHSCRPIRKDATHG